MQITRLLCPVDKYSIKCPDETVMEGITVHNTYNDASAMSEASYALGRPDKVSFHVAVDNYRVVELLPLNRSCYAAGDGRYGFGNAKTINIEICYSKSGGNTFDEAERLAAEYIAYLLKQYGWGIEKVGKHQDRSGKYCPHRTLDLGWERFLNMIREYLGEATKVEGYLVTVTADSLNVRNGAGVNHDINTSIKQGEVYTIVEECNGWGKLKSGAGWINLKYTTKGTGPNPQPQSKSTSKYVLGLYVVTASALNVRSGPGTNYKIKKSYKKGTRFDTYELNGSWARTPSGWVNLDYCSLVKKY